MSTDSHPNLSFKHSQILQILVSYPIQVPFQLNLNSKNCIIKVKQGVIMHEFGNSDQPHNCREQFINWDRGMLIQNEGDCSLNIRVNIVQQKASLDYLRGRKRGYCKFSHFCLHLLGPAPYLLASHATVDMENHIQVF